MIFSRVIGRCLLSQMRFKRDSAKPAALYKRGYMRLGYLCQTCSVAKGSSKLWVTHCQNRYPSPDGWSDHTRVWPPTFFQDEAGRQDAGSAAISGLIHPCAVPVGETMPCGDAPKVAKLATSGANTSGNIICSALLNLSHFWAQSARLRPAKAPASNARPWALSAVRWRQLFWIPTSRAAHLSAAWPGRPAIRPVCASADLTRRSFKGRRGTVPGGLFLCPGATRCSARY